MKLLSSRFQYFYFTIREIQELHYNRVLWAQLVLKAYILLSSLMVISIRNALLRLGQAVQHLLYSQCCNIWPPFSQRATFVALRFIMLEEDQYYLAGSFIICDTRLACALEIVCFAPKIGLRQHKRQKILNIV